MKIKRIDLLNLERILESMKTKKGTKFQYAILKNLNSIKAETKLIEDMVKPSARLEEYENKRIGFCRTHADKDENGRPIVVDNQFQFNDEGRKLFQEEVKKLYEEYKTDIDEFNKTQMEVMNFELEVDLHKVKVEDLPADLDGNDLEALKDIIAE